MNQQTEFSKLLKQLRQGRQLRQRDLADTCKIKQPLMSQLESGKRKPSPQLLDCLSKALQLTADQRSLFFLAAGYLEEGDKQTTKIVAPPEFQSVLTTLSDPNFNNLPGPLARGVVKEFADSWHLYAEAKEKQYKREWRGTDEICDDAVTKLHSATSRLEAYIYDAKGSAALSMGNLAEARRSFQKVQKLLEIIDDPYLEGQLLTHQGEVLRATGEWREAEFKFKAASKVFVGLEGKIKSTKGAWIDRKLGLLYLLQGEWDKGIRHLTRSESVFQALDDKYELAKNYLSLGWAYTMNGDWHQAQKYRSMGMNLSEQYRVMEQQPDEFLKMQGLVYTGLTLHQIGSIDQARKYLESAKHISDKLEEMHERSTILIGLGLLYSDIYKTSGNQDNDLLKLAKEYFEIAAKETLEVGDKRRYARALTYQATLYLKPGKAHLAIDLLEDARRIFRALEHHYFLATVAVFLGRAYYMTKVYNSMNICVNEGIQEAQSYRRTYYRQLSELRILKAKWYCYQSELEETARAFANALADAIQFNRAQCEKIADQVVESIECDENLEKAFSRWGRITQKYFNERIQRERQLDQLSPEQEMLIKDVDRWLEQLRTDPTKKFQKRALNELQSLNKSLSQ